MRFLKAAAIAALLSLVAPAAFAAPFTYASPTFNYSSTIVTGGTFQVIANANTDRQSLDFVNESATDKCYLFFGYGTATTAKSIPVAAGQEKLINVGVIPSDEVQATCASTNDAYYFATQ